MTTVLHRKTSGLGNRGRTFWQRTTANLMPSTWNASGTEFRGLPSFQFGQEGLGLTCRNKIVGADLSIFAIREGELSFNIRHADLESRPIGHDAELDTPLHNPLVAVGVSLPSGGTYEALDPVQVAMVLAGERSAGHMVAAGLANFHRRPFGVVNEVNITNRGTAEIAGPVQSSQVLKAQMLPIPRRAYQAVLNRMAMFAECFAEFFGVFPRKPLRQILCMVDLQGDSVLIGCP